MTIGCEEKNYLTINCHGNPLIVEIITQQLALHGVELVSGREILTKILTKHHPNNTIAVEAKLAQTQAKTIEGTKIILNQIETGLYREAAGWLDKTDAASLRKIQSRAAEIIKAGRTARIIINGCKIVLTGPPNTGKSTMLNHLAGSRKAVTADAGGTTRDWVTAACQIHDLFAVFIDTAGVDEKTLAGDTESIEKTSQERSLQMLDKADLILLVLDINDNNSRIGKALLEKITGKKAVAVLNKCDLVHHLDISRLPEILKDNTVQISALTGSGTDGLLKKISDALGVSSFDNSQPVCFTGRQEGLLEHLIAAKSDNEAVSAITELLNGKIQI